MKLIHLRYFDILFLSVLLFGWAIYSSNHTLFLYFTQDEALFFGDEVGFDDAYDDYSGLIQGILLILALFYLKFINFDFSLWEFKISPKETAKAILLFCFLGLMMDIFLYIFEPSYSVIALKNLDTINISSILYAFLNGIYEELFFLGICLSVKSENIKKAFIFSLFIRFSFHTYQGLCVAFGLGILLGSAMFFVYEILKVRNLYVFFFAHALADIFGLSFLTFLTLP